MLKASENIESFNLNAIKSNLPYVVIPSTGDKLLIDTGSTRTLISPLFVETYFPDKIQKHNFTITTSHSTTNHDEIADIPINELFHDPGTHTCYLYDFNPQYVGLIGSDLLSKLNASVDFNWLHVQTENTTVPFFYNNSKIQQEKQKRNQCNFSKVIPQTEPIKRLFLPARTECRISLPVTNSNGTFLCEKIKFNKFCYTPTSLVKVHNGRCHTTAINISETDHEFRIYNAL